MRRFDIRAGGLVALMLGVPPVASASTLESRPEWIFSGSEEIGTHVGEAVTVGDFDGDGHDDLLIAPRVENETQWAVLLFSGGPEGLRGCASRRIEARELGSLILPHPTLPRVAAADFNGDGFADLLFGDTGTRDTDWAGQAWVLEGPGLVEAAVWQVQGSEELEGVGGAVTSAGDVNADGYDDALVWSARPPEGEQNQGLMELYLGGPDGLREAPAWWRAGSGYFSRYGDPAIPAGDIDADGYGDVLLRSRDGGGTLELFRGAETGLSGPAWTMTAAGPGQFDEWGARFTTLDLDRDGRLDLAVGSGSWSGNDYLSGLIQLFRGSNTSPYFGPEYHRIEGLGYSEQLGWSVGWLPDLSLFLHGGHGIAGEGYVRGFHVNQGVPIEPPAWEVEQPTGGYHFFGHALHVLDPLSGAGETRLAVSDARYPGLTNASLGAVFVYRSCSVEPCDGPDQPIEASIELCPPEPEEQTPDPDPAEPATTPNTPGSCACPQEQPAASLLPFLLLSALATRRPRPRS